MTKAEMKEYLKASELCLQFLDKGKTNNGSWKDENGNGLITDIGYMYDGLKDMRDYLKEQIGE